MAEYAGQLTDTAREALGEESFVAAIKCMVEGHAKRKGLGAGLFGAVGALTATSGKRDGHAIGGEPLPKELALGLSPTRLFAFPLSKMTGKATMPAVAIVPIGQVAGVDTRLKRTFGTKQLVIGIAFVDGSNISVETVRGHVEAGEKLADQLRLATEHN
jgi:hypothetical protein